MKKVLIYIIVLLILITGVSAITGALGNAKAILRPEVQAGQTIILDYSIIPQNPNDVPIHVILSLDEEFSDMVFLSEEDFILQPGEERKVPYTITVSDPYTHEGRIIARFNSVDGKGAGVALSSKIIIIGTEDNPEVDDPVIDPNQSDPNVDDPSPNEPVVNSNPNNPPTGGVVQEPPKQNLDKSPKANPIVGLALLLLIPVIGLITLFTIIKAQQVKK